jgi:hypothetical protein
MFPTSEGFIPLTQMRKIVYDYIPENINSAQVKEYIDNISSPMQI